MAIDKEQLKAAVIVELQRQAAERLAWCAPNLYGDADEIGLDGSLDLDSLVDAIERVCQ